MLGQRVRTYGEEDQTLVFRANTYRLMQRFAPAETDPSNAPLNAARKRIIFREQVLWDEMDNGLPVAVDGGAGRVADPRDVP